MNDSLVKCHRNVVMLRHICAGACISARLYERECDWLHGAVSRETLQPLQMTFPSKGQTFGSATAEKMTVNLIG